MKISIKTNQILNALHMLSKVVSNKTTIPILRNIVILPNDDSISLIGTDNMSIFLKIDLECEVNNKPTKGFCIPMKYFYDFVNFTLEEEIYIENINDTNIRVYTDKSSIDINGMDISEYPNFPDVKKGNLYKLSGDKISKCIDTVIFAASKDLSRIKFTGVSMQAQGNELVFASTDGQKLAECTIKMTENIFEQNPFKIILPANTANILINMLSNAANIDFYVDNKQISLIYNNITLFSLLIEGDYPNYKSVITDSFTTKLTINKQMLISEIKKTMIFETTTYNVSILNYEDNKLFVSSAENEKGNVKGYVNIENAVGENLRIAFNSQYLLDILNKIKTDTVEINFNTATGPAIIRINNDDIQTIFLLMPLRC